MMLVLFAAAFAALNTSCPDRATACIKLFRENMDYGATGIDSLNSPGVDIVPLPDTTVTRWWERGGERRGTAEWLIPRGMDAKHEGVRILFLHGGGYSSYSPWEYYRTLSTRVALLTQLPVLAIDYRLIPEHPFPAGVQDAVDGMEWIWDNGPHGPSRASKVFIVGDSAGAGLVLSLQLAQISGTIDGTVKLSPKQASVPHSAGTVLYSAYTDLTCSLPSYTTRVWKEKDMTGDPVFSSGNVTEDLLVSQASGLWYLDGTDYTWKNPIASPYWAPNKWLRALPDSLLIVGDAELMLDDTVAFAEKVKRAGNKHVYESSVYPRMWHDHIMYTEGCEIPPKPTVSLPEAVSGMKATADFILARV